MKRTVSLFLAMLLVFAMAGCQEKAPAEQASIGSQYWKQYPALEAGSFHKEPLAVQPWNCGRLEATSYEKMAETQNGYYLVYMNYLFYADKTDLSRWIPVCSQPDCSHTERGKCTAIVLNDRIIVKDNRLFTTAESGTYPEIYDGNHATVVISLQGDGTDPKLEYVLEEGVYYDSAAISAALYSNQLLYNSVVLQKDGTWNGFLYRVTENGTEKLAEVADFDSHSFVTSTPTEIVYGVNLFKTTLLDNTGRLYYYYENDILKHFDILQFPGAGGYLSNGTVRYMKSGDGYYDFNLETGEERFLEKARLENSSGRILLPNCIIETTLIGSNASLGNTTAEHHAMELFDGIQWRRVTLPKELKTGSEYFTVSIMGAASDRILIACQDSRYQTAQYGYRFAIYQILLDNENLEMTFCGELQLP